MSEPIVRTTLVAAASDIAEVCEVWCGRAEAPDGCLCLGKLRRVLAELEARQPATPQAAAEVRALAERLRQVLSGHFDPRSEWPGRRR
jgi:hypothetical protein